jgi:arginyl-tRNA synthetase
MKKVNEADIVLNVICIEQNLPQEKVMPSLKALGIPGRPQFHMAYELVKLTKGGEVQRMSGRRGIYCLIDELYEMFGRASLELKVNKQLVEDDQHRKAISHVLTTAAMKDSLSSVSPRMEIGFDVQTAVDLMFHSFAWSGPRGVAGYTEAHACAWHEAGPSSRIVNSLQ